MAEPKNQQQKEYQRRVNEKMPKGRNLYRCFCAFISGGAICVLGQAIHDFGEKTLLLGKEDVAAFTAMALVFIGATLTGLGVYDKIGSWAGAGSIVPITGFANSVVAPAMEFKREGYVLGVGAKLFTIAGPVLVYGITASVAVGLIACIVG